MQEQVQGPPLLVRVTDAKLDFNSAWLVKQHVVELIREGYQRIALEISAVTFIDSNGLATFASIAQLLDGEGLLVISGVRTGVMSMLKLTRLDKVLRIFPDEREAIAALLHLRAESAE